jgi:Arc/MetJ-type ribon-helix-helix transcriptional regulator
MSEFDYKASAELFVAAGRSGLRYRRFASAADAIRFAVERLPAATLSSSRLEVEERQYDAKQTRALYDSDSYPLQRIS